MPQILKIHQGENSLLPESDTARDLNRQAVCVAGATGRVGRNLVAELSGHPSLELVVALVGPGSLNLNEDSGAVAGCEPNEVPLRSSPDGEFDVLIDFSRPEAIADHLQYCIEQHSAMVLGTTGLSDEQEQQVCDAAKQIPIVWAPNTSLGHNLCLELLKLAAKVLPKEDWDVEIVENHHRSKKDNPSGTALSMGRLISEVRTQDFESEAEFRQRGVGEGRERGRIGFSVIRGGGEKLGCEHSVLFIGDEELVEIRQRSANSGSFAHGALQAAEWLRGKQPGMYYMSDVLNIEVPSEDNG